MAATNPPPSTADKTSPRLLVSYEVQVLQDDRWLIDQAGTDEAALLQYAQELVRRREAQGVRLVREMHNVAEERSSFRILFERVAQSAGGGRDSGKVERSSSR